MRAGELGEFLRSRRERISPADVGFPASVRRRAPGLRREELSSVAGVTVSWLAKLEQGKAHSVSPEVLAALARALRLDDVETEHLFALAGFRADRRPAPRHEVTPALRVLLEELEPNPAYLLDRAWDIVAWNQAESALFPGLLRYPYPPNLLDLVFRDDELAHLMVDHDEECKRLVSQFRLHCSDWPDDPTIKAIIEWLEQSHVEFTRLWAARDVTPFVTTRRVFAHPLAGRLEFDHHRLAVLDQPGIQLVLYTAVPGSDSALRLQRASTRRRR